MKNCSKCNELRDITDYYKKGKGKRRADCRFCCKKARDAKKKIQLKETRGRKMKYTDEQRADNNKRKCRAYYKNKQEQMKRRATFLYKRRRIETRLIECGVLTE
ncbi:MAG: hypothetical protein ACW99Q_15315 [Candidatus Kariarchaeaceae archaeon]